MIRLFLFFFCLLVARASHPAELVIGEVWVRVPIGQAKLTAGYLKIQNTSETDDSLISAKAAGVARIEVHRTSMGKEGVTRMRPINALDIPAGETVALQQGANHLMLIGVEVALSDGDNLPLTVTFEKAGELRVDAIVTRINPFP